MYIKLQIPIIFNVFFLFYAFSTQYTQPNLNILVTNGRRNVVLRQSIQSVFRSLFGNIYQWMCEVAFCSQFFSSHLLKFRLYLFSELIKNWGDSLLHIHTYNFWFYILSSFSIWCFMVIAIYFKFCIQLDNYRNR